MSYINLNGQIIEASAAYISYDNRAFRYGYGLFETMHVKDGRIELMRYHYERLINGLKKLQFDVPSFMTLAWLEEEVMRTVRKNSLERLCRVRLQCYAGEGAFNDNTNQKPLFIIECFALEKHLTELNSNGLEIGIANGLFKSADSLANIKSTNALTYLMAAKQARSNNWDDALILNNHGNVIESTVCNIFCIKEGVVITPPLEEGCVAGVMRRFILETLPQKGFVIKEAALTISDIYVAESIFLTNAIRKVKWVASFNDNAYESDVPHAIYDALFV